MKAAAITVPTLAMAVTGKNDFVLISFFVTNRIAYPE
jgi:hypothetical protein